MTKKYYKVIAKENKKVLNNTYVKLDEFVYYTLVNRILCSTSDYKEGLYFMSKVSAADWAARLDIKYAIVCIEEVITITKVH